MIAAKHLTVFTMKYSIQCKSLGLLKYYIGNQNQIVLEKKNLICYKQKWESHRNLFFVPFIFLIIINDLPTNVETNIVFYADAQLSYILKIM